LSKWEITLAGSKGADYRAILGERTWELSKSVTGWYSFIHVETRDPKQVRVPACSLARTLVARMQVRVPACSLARTLVARAQPGCSLLGRARWCSAVCWDAGFEPDCLSLGPGSHRALSTFPIFSCFFNIANSDSPGKQNCTSRGELGSLGR
jgi:hypothetical protein